jgi:hypothetical protein
MEDVEEDALVSNTTSASTSTLGISSMEVDSLNTDVAQQLYLKEAEIVLDYSGLRSVGCGLAQVLSSPLAHRKNPNGCFDAAEPAQVAGGGGAG